MPAILQSLRQELREKFPDAHQDRATESRTLVSTLPDFPKGALSELSPAGPSSSLCLVLAQLLAPKKSKIQDPGSPEIALIDGRDAFDPASYGTEACSRLLWIRCHHAAESLRCADLLLHDGNLPLLTLDLQLNPLRELQDIPTASWYRLRNLARQSGCTLLAFTPRPLIPAAALQLTFPSAFDLKDLERHGNLVEGQRSESRRSGTI